MEAQHADLLDCLSMLPDGAESQTAQLCSLGPESSTARVARIRPALTLRAACKPRSRAAASKALQGWGEHWANLHPLSHALRVRALSQLQPLAEIQVQAASSCLHRQHQHHISIYLEGVMLLKQGPPLFVMCLVSHYCNQA